MENRGTPVRCVGSQKTTTYVTLMPLESVQGSRVLKICLRGLDLEDERGMVRRDPPGSRSGVYSGIRGTCVFQVATSGFSSSPRPFLPLQVCN